jgi:hypothetical protein
MTRSCVWSQLTVRLRVLIKNGRYLPDIMMLEKPSFFVLWL